MILSLINLMINIYSDITNPMPKNWRKRDLSLLLMTHLIKVKVAASRVS